jgi:hypothetical protein
LGHEHSEWLSMRDKRSNDASQVKWSRFILEHGTARVDYDARAGVVELVDTRGLGPRVARRAGSSPVPGTTHV